MPIRNIKPIAQPQGSKLCWAAVTAMILGRDGDGAVQQILAEAKAKNVPLFANNSLDTVTGVSDLAKAFGLKQERFTGMVSGEDIATRLLRGPCGLMGEETTGKHAVACHGVVGEDLSDAAGVQVLGVDPRGFTAINMDLWGFQKEFSIMWIMYQ